MVIVGLLLMEEIVSIQVALKLILVIILLGLKPLNLIN
jgi:hypothetical protein